MVSAASLQTVFLLLVIYQLKQFVADFPLQGHYMLRKFSPGWDFLLPLTLHCVVHAALTLAIVLLFKPSLWWLSLVDFAIHFVMDRIKAGPRYLGRFNDVTKTSYWVTFGFDQMVHHLTHFLIIWIIVTTP